MPEVPAAPVTLPDRAEHKSSRQLLGQLADGAAVPQSEIGIGAECGLHDGPGGTSGHQPLAYARVQLDTAASVQ